MGRWEEFALGGKRFWEMTPFSLTLPLPAAPRLDAPETVDDAGCSTPLVAVARPTLGGFCSRLKSIV